MQSESASREGKIRVYWYNTPVICSSLDVQQESYDKTEFNTVDVAEDILSRRTSYKCTCIGRRVSITNEWELQSETCKHIYAVKEFFENISKP